ncbi:hypothetical protein KA001_02780 [Patescibacteria group bacterium]|nr:hypothetical protein [Patescibacteria group bacterium]
MVISAFITNYYAFGLVIDEDLLTVKSFNFALPFPSNRQSGSTYFKEVIEKVYAECGISKNSCEMFIATSQDTLFKSPDFKNVTRILDLLSTVDYPYLYVGETKGAINKIVLPFIINPSDFYHWFYLADNINDVENHFYNRLGYGVRKPASKWEEGFEESLFREKLSFIFENSKKQLIQEKNDIVIFGEGLNYAGDNKRIVLSFLDAVSFDGFWKIFYDSENLIINFKNIEKYNPTLFQKLSDKHKIVDLAGCLIVPDATRIDFKENSSTNNLSVNLELNSISIVPYEKKDIVDVKVTRKNGKNYFIKVRGGELGLVVDNRARPLLKDQNAKQRFLLMEKWMKDFSSKIEITK